MSWINKRQFEKKVTEFLHKEKTEGLQESSAPDSISLAGDTNRRRKFIIQDEEINVNDSLLNESATISQIGVA